MTRLTDTLRAQVFARDKGICSFSGLSVWALDFGATPFYQMDWADHAKPFSRAGGSSIDNLVCASHFYNYKKRNNTSDQSYLFHAGRPTKTFFWNHGELSAAQSERLARHSALRVTDWYFGRAIFNILTALYTKWEGRHDIRRRPEYWLGSARKRLAAWQRVTEDRSSDSFLRRGLVLYPDSPDVRLLLELADKADCDLNRIYERLFDHFQPNADSLNAFVEAQSQAERTTVVRNAETGGLATEPMLWVLRRNLDRLDGLPDGEVPPLDNPTPSA